MKKSLLFGFLFLLAFATGSPAPASATILFASSEDTGFTFIGSVGVSTTLRANFSRGSLFVSPSGSAIDPPLPRFETPTFTPTSTLWVHGQVVTNSSSSNATFSNEQTVLIRSPDGVSRIVVRQTGANGQLKISTRNAAGTLTDLATTAINVVPFDVGFAFDLFVNYTCSSAGGAQLYLQGVQVINFTGNPCTDSATQLNQVGFSAITNAGSTFWAEMILADEDTRGMALWQLAPAAAGNSQTWTPNTLANINKTTINDTTSISTSANNALSEWTTPTSASAPNGSWTVRAVVQEARVAIGTTGPQHFEWVARTTDGSDNVTGSLAPNTSFANFSNQLWLTNPHTGSAWSLGDIGTGFNLGIESLP